MYTVIRRFPLFLFVTVSLTTWRKHFLVFSTCHQARHVSAMKLPRFKKNKPFATHIRFRIILQDLSKSTWNQTGTSSRNATLQHSRNLFLILNYFAQLTPFPAGEHLRARHGDAPRDRHLQGPGGAACRQGGQDGARPVLQALQVSPTGPRPKTNEVKSVAGNHWLRLSPSVALLRGQVWSSLGIRCQQQQLVD